MNIKDSPGGVVGQLDIFEVDVPHPRARGRPPLGPVVLELLGIFRLGEDSFDGVEAVLLRRVLEVGDLGRGVELAHLAYDVVVPDWCIFWKIVCVIRLFITK